MVNLLPWRSIDSVWLGGWRGFEGDGFQKKLIWVVVSNIFSSRTLGKWFNLTNIFQMGCNHQLVINNSKRTSRFQFTGIVPSTSKSFENMWLIGSTRFEIETSTPYNITSEMTDMVLVRLDHKSWLFFRFGAGCTWTGTLYQTCDGDSTKAHFMGWSCQDESQKLTKNWEREEYPSILWLHVKMYYQEWICVKKYKVNRGETHLSGPFKATPKPPASHDPVSRPH